LGALDHDLAQRIALDPADAHEVLSRHIGDLARRALRSVSGRDVLAAQVEVANQMAEAIRKLAPRAVDGGDLVASTHDLLTAVTTRPPAPQLVSFPVRPEVPLASGALLVNGRNQPRIGAEVAHEMQSADQVDLLCAFIKWYGLRLVEEPIRDLIARGGRLRVITTTYLGATDQRALERLAELGAEIRVSYETRTTRLHAKAWLFRRSTGAGTAYVGSSNLSRAAMVDGVEWNVRLAQLEQPALLDTFAATFDEYWADPSFEEYEPQRDAGRLRTALALESGPRPTDLTIDVATLDVRPYGYQQEILDGLDTERRVHSRWRNLVVMATGTGKTVVAALDYRRLRQAGTADSLLFVAHQRQILRQSRSVFRQVLRDGTFGEMFVDGERPADWRHVFASVQSLSRMDPTDLDPDRFDVVIVDEFHHAEAPTYSRLLAHLRPRVLLGLTATPERSDGQDVRRWFGGRTAVELRLWEALERQLLVPFHYFGIHDDIDLTVVPWRRGRGYDQRQLGNLYTGHEARVRLIMQALRDKVDVTRMRALGFCVDINHAEFMAERFVRAGVPALALTSAPGAPDREAAVRRLESGDLRVIFTVDLFNEGVDVPSVDTVLLLRPTESATVFLQQIGRGLRLANDKPCLTVLDFVGMQHREFRFDLRLRALTGRSRRALERDITTGFPTLPAGCHIQLDRVAQKIVLDNVRSSLRVRKADLVGELRTLGDISLTDFLAETGLEVEDVYRSRTLGGWTGLRRGAGLVTVTPSPLEAKLSAAIGRMLHVDDTDRLDRLIRSARSGDRLEAMIRRVLWGGESDVDVDSHPQLRREVDDVAAVLRRRIRRVTEPLDPTGRNPLRVHARYSRDEACLAFGFTDFANFREGVKWLPDEQADVFFVTLNKTERHYSPTTMYEDRAITPELFQWESQSTTSAASGTGQRYINHARRGSTVHLFVRETKEADGALGVPAYLYAGPMTYVRHTNDRPMRIVWQLATPLPADIFHAARVAAG
jgi:superfamily II DNA or RNA helicase/HKD family nuclease